MPGKVVSVGRNARHALGKPTVGEIHVLAGLGVEGDTHAGVTVQHRSRVRADPTQPNLRQVHLIERELIATLQAQCFDVEPGTMGENVTTEGLDLLGLPTGARLRLGGEAVVEVTGLRNPCSQLDKHEAGLLAAVVDRDAAGNLIRKAGIMGVVITGGAIRPGDQITVDLPPEPHRPLERV